MYAYEQICPDVDDSPKQFEQGNYYSAMNKSRLQQLSEEELRQEFRKHNIRGIIISLSLLAVFLIIYFIPLGIDPDLQYDLFIGLIVLSAGYGLWYNLSKRKYFKEFRRRNKSF